MSTDFMVLQSARTTAQQKLDIADATKYGIDLGWFCSYLRRYAQNISMVLMSATAHQLNLCSILEMQ